MQLFRPALEARFLERPNRFVALVETPDGVERVHCPNPGRLSEILLPGRTVLLERASTPGRKTRFTLAAALYRDRVVPLDSARANRVAAELILPRLYPGAAVRPEPRVGRSRFDFLIRQQGNETYIEVKACTLVEHGTAMFPDAPTERGRRHLMELAELAEADGIEGRVLFVLMHSDPERFVPSLHTDPAFARTLRAVRGRIDIKAVSVEAGLDGTVRLVNPDVPVDLAPVRWAEEDRGCYVVILRLPRARQITVGSLGELDFPAGFYAYVGSARRGLTARTNRHLRKRKRRHWHIDHLLAEADRVKAHPIFTGRDLECELGRAVRAVADGVVPGFGSSDCGCPSHAMLFRDDPMGRVDFLEVLLRLRHREGLIPPISSARS